MWVAEIKLRLSGLVASMVTYRALFPALKFTIFNVSFISKHLYFLLLFLSRVLVTGFSCHLRDLKGPMASVGLPKRSDQLSSF